MCTGRAWIARERRGGRRGRLLRGTDLEADKARMRVLYVEDDDDNREITAAQLERMGHEVVVSAGASEAKAALGQPFDVVVVDLQLPDGDGWDVARAVKRQAPGTPVVVLTGWGGVVAADVAHARGVEGVILKPITADKLARVISTAAGRVA
jgi:CheY-like chemotaxis protein